MHRYYGEICSRGRPVRGPHERTTHTKVRLSELPKTRFFKLEVEPAPPISTV